MTVIYFILLMLAAVCFIGAAFSVVVQRVNLLALGLFFWVLVLLIQVVQKV